MPPNIFACILKRRRGSIIFVSLPFLHRETLDRGKIGRQRALLSLSRCSEDEFSVFMLWFSWSINARKRGYKFWWQSVQYGLHSKLKKTILASDACRDVKVWWFCNSVLFWTIHVTNTSKPLHGDVWRGGYFHRSDFRFLKFTLSNRCVNFRKRDLWGANPRNLRDSC